MALIQTKPYSPVEFAQLMETKGAGEIIVQSVDTDGMMRGYDIDLVKSISRICFNSGSGYWVEQEIYQT